jgi:hypothetical protein
LATPARKITNRGSKKNIGKFFSFKMQSLIWYESLNERDYMYLLEIDPDVVSYRSQPLKISYTLNHQLRQYTPDFLVERRSREQIVEIKPEKRLNQEYNLQLFQAITKLGQSQGWEFVVITDKMIKKEPLLSNLKLLYRYAQIRLTLQNLMVCHQYFNNQPPIPLLTAQKYLQPQGITQGMLLKLIFLGFLETDLRNQVIAQSQISLSGKDISGELLK